MTLNWSDAVSQQNVLRQALLGELLAIYERSFHPNTQNVCVLHSDWINELCENKQFSHEMKSLKQASASEDKNKDKNKEHEQPEEEDDYMSATFVDESLK